ncbi:acyltransferase [Flavobacterium suzhouense]|uniref:Acyltransferase n=1 Tax=Flavobacterium suzhouense TaxID=1529638 RepID=A0ABW5NVY1_9FLAO
MNKIEWIENLRVLATLSVITLHVAAPGTYNIQTVPFTDWWISAIFESLRFCVPVFVMITGALLLNKDYETSVFLKKKLVHILYPFLLYSLIYICFSYNLKRLITEQNFIDFLKHCFYSLKNGSYYHLWYIYMLIGLYIMTPIIRSYVKSANKKNIKYFLFLWLIYNFIKGYALNDLFPNLYFPVAIDYLGYFILGHYLYKYPIDKRKLGFAMFVIGTLSSFLIIFYFGYTKNEMRDLYFGYNTLNVVIQSIGAYLWIYNSKIRNPLATKFRDILSQHSYSIYLAHALVLTIMINNRFTWNIVNPVVGIISSVLFCTTATLVACIILKKIPVIGKFF